MDDTTPLNPENWLITPEFEVPGPNTFLNYWVGSFSAANFHEKYRVYIADPASSDILDFVPLTGEIPLTEGAWIRKSHSLNSVVPETTIRIAFVHIGQLVTNRSALRLDGISVIAPATNVEYEYDLMGWRLYRNAETLPGNLGPGTFSSVVTHNAGWNHYWATARFFDGEHFYESYPGNIVSIHVVSDSDIVAAQTQTRLGANYPNPFNPETVISFAVAGNREQGIGNSSNSLSFGEGEGEGIRQSNVKIDIYNIKGQRVKSLVDGMYAAGEHTVVWNGTDDNGRSVTSGIYFYRMVTDDYQATRKMILMK